ncbi:MAG: hypothetical protein LBH46_04460 [Rickettsiales bacterium]|jgi:hypothetical protein|nr:hypothetical protein [Rickettsiales bacterium]
MKEYIVIFAAIVLLILILRLFLKIIIYALSRLYTFNRARRIKKRKDTPIKINQEEIKIVKKIDIVGVAKPVGLWSSLILGDELTKVFNEVGKDNMKGFWKNLAEAEAKKHAKNKKIN